MIYKGIAYPLTKHPQGFFHNAISDMAQIKSDMAAIILTEPGERIFIPNFGTGLDSVNTNAPKQVAISAARLKVATSLKKWEKRIQVHDVVVDFAKDENNKLILKITVLFLNPANIQNIENLTVYKTLGGSNGRNMPFWSNPVSCTKSYK